MCVCVCVCVCTYVCMYVRTLLSIYMSKMSDRDYKNLKTNFDCTYCQNFSMKTKFIFVVLFILITLVGLHNTHVLNYTININKKNCIPNTRKHF